ncbi:MAG: hypothetical protein NTV39_04350 [Candidatus Saccharibacteria bacterium]|nr:hypothetical protein [Candidatus Saccharibacteria bacterium]
MKKKKKAKVTRKPPKFSRRTLFLRKLHRTLKLITKQRVYITFGALALLIVASSAAYALNNRIDLNKKSSNPTSSTSTTTSTKNDNVSDTKGSEKPNPTITTDQAEPTSCYQIQTTAETQFLKTTSALVYPHYGNPKAVFDAYNSGYRQAYNNYLATIRAHNCAVTVADKGDVQYGSPVCTQAYADNNVVVLRNQIYSGVNLDMAEYERWKDAGHHSSWDPSYQSYSSYQSEVATEQNYIQNQNNARIRGYVGQTNAILNSIFCPSLNPTDFYTHMF